MFPHVLVLFIMLLSAGIHIYYVMLPICLAGPPQTAIPVHISKILFFSVYASAFPELAYSKINDRFHV